MNLDLQVCSRARLTRDARFDGKFFIGVLSTGVYCRPICPSRTSKEINVRYYATAAAAAEAGFRPCLRCRPECSPGTPAWVGTPSTVSRALRLIGEGGLEEGGLELLAERLGVGSRHLRRLFVRHLGATPNAVAQTRRLHFAKKLLDETRLPMTEIAIASGFRSVRRFNAAIRKVYHRSPTELRRLAKQSGTPLQNQYHFHLGFRPPYDWDGMLKFLGTHAIPGVESVDANRYRRSISVNGENGFLEVDLDDRDYRLNLRVWFPDPRSLYFITERIRVMFDLSADWSAIVRSLKNDPFLGERVQAGPGLRIPGCWDGFEVAVCAVLGQGMSGPAANLLQHRLVERFGKSFAPANGLTHLFPTPQALATAELPGLGISKAQATMIRALARASCEGHLCFNGTLSTEIVLQRLSQAGVDKYTAHYIAMRALGETDAFPASGDDLLSSGLPADPAELEKRAENWRPWRAYAAMYLCNSAQS